MSAQSKPLRLGVASSNEGKLREYRALAGSAGASLDLVLIPNFDALPKFDEVAETFAENAVGKALHYSRLSEGLVIADDSGLVVPALGAEGELLDAPRGEGGFGYDPIFFFPVLGKTYAEVSREEKNQYSHRGKAFRKALDFLASGS